MRTILLLLLHSGAILSWTNLILVSDKRQAKGKGQLIGTFRVSFGSRCNDAQNILTFDF
jgi:hypothetical protein